MPDGQLGVGYEDLMTTLETLAAAQPADQARFLKSIENTPQGDQLRSAINIYQESGKTADPKSLTKSFKEAFDKK